MRILILGSGGREHALAWKMKQSDRCDKLFVAPGNAGTASIAQNVKLDVNDFVSIGEFCLENAINMLIVGPEDPLVNGIYDFFIDHVSLRQVTVIGPSKAAAQLEGSKDFAKKFMAKYDIPTADYKTFSEKKMKEGLKYIDEHEGPYVLKADGLAAGKGVLILQTREEAKEALKDMIEAKKFGVAGTKVVIEEFLDGMEFSVFVVTDGVDYKIMPVAKDYKRIGEGDKGANTGGMGAVSHPPFVTEDLMKKVEKKIIKRTLKGLRKEKMNYKGFIFIGLILVDGKPKVIEYNVRMGDPETEVVIPRIKNDFLPILESLHIGNLKDQVLDVDTRVASTVMLVSGGYPEKYAKGKEIKGLSDVKDCLVFHAGTRLEGSTVVTNGGRVIAVTALADDLETALKISKENAEKITYEGKYYRKDIGYEFI